MITIDQLRDIRVRDVGGVLVHPDGRRPSASPPVSAVPPEPVPVQPAGGVGTELKKLLALIGIQPKPGCQCNARAAEMDRKGVEWCKQHREIIIDWLAEEAKKRTLVGKLFNRTIAHQALSLAIKRADKEIADDAKR